MLPGIKGSHMLGSVGVALPALLNSMLLPINNFKLLSICVGLAELRPDSYGLNGANVQIFKLCRAAGDAFKVHCV